MSRISKGEGDEGDERGPDGLVPPSDVDTVSGETPDSPADDPPDTVLADTLAAPRVASPRPSTAEDPTQAATHGAATEASVEDQHLAARRIGRHVVFERIGAGGMGEVFAAWDPELDRRIAIKLLRPSPGREGERRDAILREAQATARISDPNVVSIFDVGTADGQVYIAMEFIEGVTLRRYATEHGRAEILAAYLQAARGLAAAHREGVVHRDFKPDNALVGVDGRVRVLDFGIAALAGDPGAAGLGIVGTPGYMSPEQLSGADVDPRSDQFSFCVALFEALEGVRPFDGRTVAEVTRAVLEDAPKALQRGQPRRIDEALRRGLSRAPEDRFPDMEALIEAITDERGRTRRRAFAWGAGAALLLLGGIGLGMASGADPGACQADHAPIHEVWDAGARENLREAFNSTNAPFAPRALEDVDRKLSSYAAEWTEAWSDACDHARRADQPPRILERRTACLDRRRERFAALVDGIQAGLRDHDPEVRVSTVEASSLAVDDLPSLVPCSDLSSLAAEVELPASGEQRAAVAGVRRELEVALADTQLARYERAIERLDDAARTAETLDYSPLTAEVALARGKTLAATQQLDAALDSLRRAYFTAYANEHRQVAADAATELIGLVGKQLDRPDEGLAWARHAAAASALTAEEPTRDLRRSTQHAWALDAADRSQEAFDMVEAALNRAENDGVPDAVRAGLLEVRASALDNLGRVDEAIETSRQLVALQEAVFGPTHPTVGRALAGLGGKLYQRRRLEEARPPLERSVALLSAAYGPESPATAVPLNALAAIAGQQGRFDESRAQYETLLEIRRKTLGPGHQHTVDTLNNLGQVLMRQGQPEAAIELLEDALSDIENKDGPDSPDLVSVTGSLATALEDLDREDEALAMANRSCALAREHFGDRHYRLGFCLHNRGRLMMNAERYDEAVADLREAIEIWSAAFGESDPRLGRSSQTLGLILFKAGRFEEARAAYLRSLANMRRQTPPVPANLYRALSGLGRTEVELARWSDAVVHLEEAAEIGYDHPGIHAHVQFALARALWATDSDRPRARALLARAHAAYADAGPDGAPYLTTLESWARQHRVPVPKSSESGPFQSHGSRTRNGRGP